MTASKHRGRKHLWIVGVDKGDLRAISIPAKEFPWSQILNLNKLIERTNRDRRVDFVLGGPFYTESDAMAFIRKHHARLIAEGAPSLNPR